MSSPQRAHVTAGNFSPDTLSEKGRTLKSAATDWAGSLKENVRGRMMETGYKTETYVRAHPGRFIVGACCIGLAAGWLLGHTNRSSKR
jgi:ElaB/YqjD/DUF883 family membrane-anchored ribosome-binding protein